MINSASNLSTSVLNRFMEVENFSRIYAGQILPTSQSPSHRRSIFRRAKANNKVWHAGLVYKLYEIGLYPGPLL